MNKISPTYQFIAFVLAFLMFFTSGGFVLGKHHCKMEQKSMVDTTTLSCAEMGCKKGCCSTDYQYFKLDQDQQNNTLDFESNKELVQFVTAYVAVFLTNDFVKKDTPSYSNYRPPLIQKDIPVLFESFLL